VRNPAGERREQTSEIGVNSARSWSMGFSWAEWLNPGFPAEDENAFSEFVPCLMRCNFFILVLLKNFFLQIDHDKTFFISYLSTSRHPSWHPRCIVGHQG
jgi:hypothetical protein